MAATQNAYELEREMRIARNKRKMQDLGVLDAKAELEAVMLPCQLEKVPKRVVRKPKAPLEAGEIRRSSRDRPKVDYSEEGGSFNERVKGPKGERRVVYVSREDLDSSLFSSPKIRSKVDSGKGVRIQGGRVYDSKLGVTCHWCRQKTLEHKVQCTAPNCGGGRKMPTTFCKMCLMNRHGEDVDEAEASGKWVCPCCRVSCGPGCEVCCNCGPCRKKAGLMPTGHVITQARDHGFDNVHDYLVNRNTGEDAETIAERKTAAPWGQWLLEESHPTTDAMEEAAPCSQAEQTAEEEGATAAAQQSITDTLKTVKTAATAASPCKPQENGMARRASRKARIMQQMGLAPSQQMAVCV